jgi:hypothetical protein
MKLILLFLFSFQSIQIPIDYYFDSYKSIIHILYKNKIEQYTLENNIELISLIDIKNSLGRVCDNLKRNFVGYYLKIF